MPTEIKVPQVGESISEVIVGEWYVKEGDFVEADADVVGLESDKATFDVPAPTSGKLVKILVQAGDEAEVGDVIGHIEPGDGGDGKRAEADREAKPAQEAPEDEEAPAPEKAEKREEKPKQRRAEDEEQRAEGEPRVMPAARRLLEEHGLSAEDVPASGPGGRLLKEDVLRHVAATKETPGQPSIDTEEPDEEVVRMSPIRKRIAQRLVEAQQNAALLTTFNDVDMSAIIALRKKYQEGFTGEHDVKLGFMSFFVKAAVDALKRFPAVNAEVRGTDVVYKNHYDIGIAVGGGKGLVVPVIRHAERLSFAEIENTINDFGKRAQSNDIRLEELEGGTFTISNGGVYGSLLSTPIVNPPQSGVLGMHRIEQRPVVVDGQVVARPMMYLALTYDHRVVDGREAVSFLVRIKECIEDPTRMILEV